MNRQQAINLLQHQALQAGKKGDHDYLPKTLEEARSWEPHEWVVDSVVAVAHGLKFLGITITYPNEIFFLGGLQDEERANFENWFKDLDVEHAKLDRPYGDGSLAESTGIECWYAFFTEGSSPADALHEDLRCA